MSMGNIVLITGGGRSGKSTYAQRLAERLPGPRVYIATAAPLDGELEDRIAKHRESRRDEHWSLTLEEPFVLARAIREAGCSPTILVDCLTIWVGNLMWAAEDGPEQRAGATEQDVAAPTEEDVASACWEIVTACREHEGTTVFVTNEVGLGIIPDNPAARLYRDLLGRCNQVIAAAADNVVLMVSGLPIIVKGRDLPEASVTPGRESGPSGPAPGAPRSGSAPGAPGS
jgi:adenosylcobinamide kinase/adenosylcobinamide-phosphate guanylyltransferase